MTERDEEIKEITNTLYDEFVKEGWNNVSLEGCEWQAINYISVRERLTDKSENRSK